MPDELPPDAPAPRLCHLIKWHDFDGYGFNLHAEKSKTGQFVGKVDDQSPAQAAGLREGDRIIEVNGVNIVCENHRQVVERIKANPRETKLLVIDEAGDNWYKEQGLVIKGSQANVVFQMTPEHRQADREEEECSAALVLDEETQSRESSDGQRHEEDEDKVATESSGANECVNNESKVESAFSSSSSPTPSSLESVSTEMKNCADSKHEQQHEEEESNTVSKQNQAAAAVQAELVASSSPAAVSSSLCETSPLPQQQEEEKADKNTEVPAAAAADRADHFKEAKMDQPAQGEKMIEKSEEEVVVVVGSLPVPHHGQTDQDGLNNNNNTIEGQSLKTSTGRDVVDSIPVVRADVKENGVNGHSAQASGSPVIPASPTSLKSNSSGSTSGNGLSSLGSGGEGTLESSLNMSVSQMRQMLAQKKKVDPKKMAMDLKQKYEIISSM